MPPIKRVNGSLERISDLPAGRTVELRRYATLGATDRRGVSTRYHFSAADYYDAERIHWGRLRALNEETYAPGFGHPTRPLRDIEIVTYVRSGAITREDGLGGVIQVEAGEVHVLSAGTGIQHSEYNLGRDAAHVLQIWLLPDHLGGMPRSGSRSFPGELKTGGLETLASGFGGDEGGMPIRSSSRVLGARLKAGDSVIQSLGSDRHAYLVAASGRLRIGEVEAVAGDGVAIEGLETIAIAALEDGEVLLVETV